MEFFVGDCDVKVNFFVKFGSVMYYFWKFVDGVIECLNCDVKNVVCEVLGYDCGILEYFCVVVIFDVCVQF